MQTATALLARRLSTIADGTAEIWLRRYDSTGNAQWTVSRPLELPPKYVVGPDVVANADALALGFNTAPGQTELLLVYPLGGGPPVLDLTPAMPLVSISGVAWAQGGDLYITAYGQMNGQMQVRRLDPTGAARWTSTACTADIAESLAVDSVGDRVAAGSGLAAGGRNIRLCKFSPDGELRWGKDIDGGQGDDDAFAVAILPDDAIVASGWMYNGTQLFDAWLAVYSP